MPKMTIPSEIEAFCRECGSDIFLIGATSHDGGAVATLWVTPCQKCMDDARDKSDSPSPASHSKLLGESFAKEVSAVKTQLKVNAILANAENCRTDGRLSPADMKVVLAACETKLAALDEKGSSDAS